ncbi:conserved Plasmodium protein, unknown function [Plasmodium gallinaceum]|uniref:Thioredoxin domain-containing protein n=1 Tax=Plasmodium gallinaceum TaxID=5849 RepID=A0A1J1GYP3_PLAGA|nr:conserved Plasmodium protein, unknown function [Plasmodium gallinaceum]CRG97576.1 conserved Plasmodium protein, unknown function [Plasmodium gallinaceum]
MEYLLFPNIKKCENVFFLFFKKFKFTSFISNHKNVNLQVLECKEINDYNFSNIIKNEKTFLIYGYADYSNRSINYFNKIIDISNKEVNSKLNKKIPIYKLNIDNNYLLVQKFHIKSIPVIQLRHKSKLIEEITGNELNELNLQKLLYRCHSYFDSINQVDDICDFLTREDELSYIDSIEDKKKNKLYFKDDNTPKEKDNICGENTKSFDSDIKQLFKNEVLDNLQLKYNCQSYVIFKKLELLLNEKKKNMVLIKFFLNEILTNHKTYLDINLNYNKITAKGFLFLFDEDLLSVEKAIELKDYLDETNQINMEILRLINFKEPIITFDNSKSIHLNEIKNLEDFLSKEEEKNDIKMLLEKNDLKENMQKIDNMKIDNNIKIKYLSRIYRILAIKYLDIGDINNMLHYALESYKLSFPLNNLDHTKSKVLIENIILYLGAYNENVIKFLSQLQFLFTDKIFKVVRFPHTRAIKGGKPIMKRGKSGKWLWLSQDWKPRWIKKKTKLILEEEWRCIPDKNVPFWN